MSQHRGSPPPPAAIGQRGRINLSDYVPLVPDGDGLARWVPSTYPSWPLALRLAYDKAEGRTHVAHAIDSYAAERDYSAGDVKAAYTEADYAWRAFESLSSVDRVAPIVRIARSSARTRGAGRPARRRRSSTSRDDGDSGEPAPSPSRLTAGASRRRVAA